MTIRQPLAAPVIALTIAGLLEHHGRAQPPDASPPGPAAGVPRTERAGMSLTVAEAVQSALANHPDLVRAKLDVEIAREEISAQHGLFQPVLTAQVAQRDDGVFSRSGGAAAASVERSRTTLLTTALTGRTRLGGTYTVEVGGTRTGFGFSAELMPLYRTQLSARYTQPLLRGFGADANRALVERAEVGEELAEVERESRRQTLALQVIAAYWALVGRREEVNLSEVSLSEAENLRELVLRRIKGGQASRSDAVQADATVSGRQQQVRQARLAVIDAERELLALTFLHKTGRFTWDKVLVPADRPAEVPIELDFDKELAVALGSRPEVRRAERAVALSRVDERIAVNDRRVRVDVYAEGGLLGEAGTANPAWPGTPPELVIGGLGKATSNMVTAKAPFFEVGVQVQIPIGNSRRSAAARQAQLRVERALADDVHAAVALEVRAAMQSFEIAIARLLGARATASLATQNLDAQRKRYEGGDATVFDLLRVQDELARARAEVVLAAAEQEIAIAHVMAARGTLLEHHGVAGTRARR